MGKFKSRNWRLHNTAPKSQFSEKKDVDKNMKFMKCTLHPNSVKNASKLFENVEIPAEVLEHQTSQHNLSENANSSLTRGVKNQASSKVHLRRRAVYAMSPRMARINAMIKKDEKFQKQKKYGSLADFDSLNDALPELPDLIKRYMDRKERIHSYRPNSFKKLDQEMMDAVETFQAVSNDESYKSDPFKAISLHIKQRMEAEKAEK